MAEFLEERFPLDVRMGATYGDAFEVQITTTQGGQEYRRLVHGFPVRHFSAAFTLEHADLWNRVIDLYHRAFGTYAGFRVRCMDDFSTNGDTGAPTALDMPLALVSAGVYQLQKLYGLGAASATVGYPSRTIRKPVAGTVKVGISGVESTAGWSGNHTTGRVTFAANKTANVSGAISKAASAVIPCAGHTFVVGESVHIYGSAGMAQINGLRGLITAIAPGASITVAINSTAFSTWTSGGVLNTRPQTGELVTAGCEFDLPCRFNGRLDVTHISHAHREVGSLDLIELLNP